MFTRRDIARTIGLTAIGRMLPEMAYAQRAVVPFKNLPSDMVWLNANENPLGPPKAALSAALEAVPTAGRYHYNEFNDICTRIAASEGLTAEQVFVGSGSTEVLHAAVDAFTSTTRPLIAIQPTYEGPVELARSLGHQVIQVPLTDGYYADVKRLIAEADKARGGVIYLCNPNNPTSAVTPKRDIQWLIANLPKDTIALIDEAYIHFAETPDCGSALDAVKAGKPVIVARTFSKIYGMAGLRLGFGAARPDLIQQMQPYRNNIVSVVAAKAAVAALANANSIVLERKAQLAKTRRELCSWLSERKLPYIDPQANFVMIDLGRDARPLIMAMPSKGVAVGRPFPPMTNFLRVSIGTDRDMAKFRQVFWDVYKGTAA